MNYSDKNIFGLVHPQRYECIVWSYRVNHQQLLIRADKDKFNNETIYFSFAGVVYFEGPISWTGASFCVGTTDECAGLFRRRINADIPEDAVSDIYRLFLIELPNSEVIKIIALKEIRKSKEIPADFSWLIE